MPDSTHYEILVTGAAGMLGQAVLRTVQRRGMIGIGLNSKECDITSPESVAAAFERYSPKVVINCAAYTKVDLAERERDQADSVNGAAVGHLAEASKRHQAKLVHISTDFVFDGRGNRPYRTEDSVGPLSAYGQSKLRGEQLLQQIDPPGWIIARTAWLYGPDGECFPKTMVKLARAGKPLKVVADQVGAPTYTADLADALLELISRDAAGLWHLTNSGQTTWHDFAQATLQAYGLPHTPPALEKTTSADWRRMYPQSAVRPAYSVLDLEPYHRLTGRTLRPWRAALADFRAAWDGQS